MAQTIEDPTEYEMAVVGAGPIGLELAVALKLAGVKYVHFDARQIGYTISWFAPQTRFFSSNERIAIAGVPLNTPTQDKATREEYLAYLRGIVQQFDLPLHTYEPVTQINRQGDGLFEITTTARGIARTYKARRITLCSGGTDRPRLLNVPGEDQPHVSHYFDDPHKYFRKKLLIVGGKNSAVEAALRCHHAGAEVSISYRRAELPSASIKYWLMPEINGLMKSERIRFFGQSMPTRISPTHVTLRQNDREFDIEADFVLALIGYEQDSALFGLAGIEQESAGAAPVYSPATMETSVKGIYVAGTCVAGTQEKYRVFIENCHEHVEKIMRAAFGVNVPRHSVPISAPES